jgi:dienelactone hydrolase
MTKLAENRSAVLARFAGMLMVLLFLASAVAAQPTLGPQGRKVGPLQPQLWLIPSPVAGLAMRTSVFRPLGTGPFPLAVLNHGSTQSETQRARWRAPKFPELTPWFLAHGYVVAVPQRPGHGETGGPYVEDQNGCENADYLTSGKNTADSIAAATNFMTSRRFVRRTGVIVVGQSAGAWGALALASRNPRGLKAVINFAGGRGGRVNNRPNNNCAPERLVNAARRFGRSARVPTLWIYTLNDSYFAPALSQRMAEAYAQAGGRVEYHLLAQFGSDGHELATSRGGEALWAPVVERFLERLH